jgi:hypothetical protein
MCRYTIRVCGNCLCSLGLDFDGDVIYLASFHTPEAKKMLRETWKTPNTDCNNVVCKLNEKVGKPHVDIFTLDDYNISPFPKVTEEQHAVIVEKTTGVKSHTGPVIALAYNLMRVIENSKYVDDQKVNIAVEVFLDRVGNTVFKQKHGVKSLHSIVVDAICQGDVETLAKYDFERETSQIICDVVREKAKQVGVSDLVSYFHKAKEKGWSNIINLIVRKQNRIYFASRSDLEGLQLLAALESPVVDMPSQLVHNVLAGKAGMKHTLMDECLDQKMVDKLAGTERKEAAAELFKLLDKLCTPSPMKDYFEAVNNENTIIVVEELRKY